MRDRVGREGVAVSGPDRRLELFVRSLAPGTGRRQQEAIVERARRLADTGVVASTELHVVGDCVCPDTVAAETGPGRFLLDRYEAFQRWAADREADLNGFRERCIDGSLGNAAVTGVTFPRVCMAEYVGDELSYVAPCVDGAETTVNDRLDALATDV